MKTLKNTVIQRVSVLLFLLIPFFSALAQEDEFADDTQDVPTAPIDDFIILLFIAAIGIGLYLLQKQIKANRNLENNLNQ